MKVLLAAVALLALTGCLTRYHKANELAQQGKFVEAAELFDQLVKENPSDPELPALVEKAHQRAVEQALGNARLQRLSGQPRASQQWFARGLELRDRWNLKLSGALESTVDDEREDATTRLRALVLPLAKKGEALAAQSVIAQHSFLLVHSELSALREELHATALQSGKESCRRMTPLAGATQPHWANLVAHYCEHFGADGPRRWTLVETFGEIRATLLVAQLSDPLAGTLQAALLQQTYEGPWYSSGGPLSAQLSVNGSVTQSRRERPVQLQAEWSERVPYVENVTRTFEESVPVNECESYEETQTINGASVKVQKVRTVTKNKTRKYQKVVAETRWRDVPRSFGYEALKIERSLSYAVRAELTVAGQSAATAGRDAAEQKDGYQHEVRFEPANVRPSTVDFGPIDGWILGRGGELAARLSQTQAEGWRAKFCRTGAYSLEDAARCARAVNGLPAEAVSALAQVLGADAPLAPALLTTSARRPPPASTR